MKIVVEGIPMAKQSARFRIAKNKNPYTRQMIYDRVQQLYYTGELELIKKTK